MNKIVWFRNDLRLSNNDAFNEAIKSGKILPIYIFDKEYHKLPTSSSFHLDFLKSSLDDLSKTLSEKYKTKLNIYYGDTLEILSLLTDKFKINEVYSNIIFKNMYITNLDKEVSYLFKEKNINDQISINEKEISIKKFKGDKLFYSSKFSTYWSKVFFTKQKNKSKLSIRESDKETNIASFLHADLKEKLYNRIQNKVSEYK